MAKIQPEDKTPIITVQFRLKADLAAKLDAYAAFLDGSSTSYVVTESLCAMFDGDKDFTAYLVANPEAVKLPQTAKAVGRPGRPKKVPPVVRSTAA